MNGTLPEYMMALSHSERRSAFQKFLEAIEFAQLPLLNNTVSKVALTWANSMQSSIKIRDHFHTIDNFWINSANRMHCAISEDTERVIYPAVDQIRVQDLQTIDLSYLQHVDTITPNVSIVLSETQRFVYKTIERDTYVPSDTQRMLEEINVLAQFRGQPNIAQLVGLVVSEHPYQTFPSSKMPSVITGFLLEYYSGGSLEQVTSHSSRLRMKWMMQIGRALESLHKVGRTHMDVKPSNVVLDSKGNAILIDIGSAEFTRKWLSPEMQLFIEESREKPPVDAPFGLRVATDCWAFGKVFYGISQGGEPGDIAESLRRIAKNLTKENPRSRITLRNALAMLEK